MTVLAVPPAGRHSEFMPPVVDTLLCTNPNSLLWHEAGEVEAQVFIDNNYVRTKEELDRECHPYLPASAMLALVNDGEVIGASRITEYLPGIGLKTVHDIIKGRLAVSAEGVAILKGLDKTRTMETGTIALREEYRGRHGRKHVGWLYAGIYGFAVERGYDTVIASFDEGYYGGFERRFSPAVRPLGPPTMYMGSLTVPAVIDVPRVNPDKFGIPKTR